MPKPSRLTAVPPLRSARLPFQGSRRELTNIAHNLSPSTRSEPFRPNTHRTDRLWRCRRQRLRRGERANISEARISSVNSLSCRYGLHKSEPDSRELVAFLSWRLAAPSWSEHTLPRPAFGSQGARNHCLQIPLFHLLVQEA